MKRPNKGPTGTEALGAIGVGLGQLFDGLKDVIERAESSSDGGHRIYRTDGDDGRPQVVTSFTSGSVDDFLKARGKTNNDTDNVAAHAQYTPDYTSAEDGIATPDPTGFESASSWEIVEADTHYLFICDLAGRPSHKLEMVIENGALTARFDEGADISAHLPADASREDPFHRVRNGIVEVRLERVPQSQEETTQGEPA
ncbi:MAG: hypothetical protein AAF141_05770 [Pseudomonadota bacterium]